MNKITISQAQKLTSPNPFALVGTCDNNGRQNLMALSWWTYVSNKPATVAVCLSQKGFSGSLIKQNMEFTLNIVGENLKKEAFSCGCASGRDTDKVQQLSVKLLPSEHITPMRVEQSRVSFECKVMQHIPVHDHDIFIAEVLEIYGDDSIRQLYTLKGYSVLDTVDY